MKTFIGIDLGSTTTKAVVMDDNRNVLGRGITNSRSNYDTAATVAKQEALLAARFFLFRRELEKSRALNGGLESFIGQLERDFRLEQYLEQLADLEQVCGRNVASARFGDAAGAMVAPSYAIPNVERNESLYPVLQVYRKHKRDSAGAGTFRGGAGIDCPLCGRRTRRSAAFGSTSASPTAGAG